MPLERKKVFEQNKANQRQLSLYLSENFVHFKLTAQLLDIYLRKC